MSNIIKESFLKIDNKLHILISELLSNKKDTKTELLKKFTYNNKMVSDYSIK